MTMTAPDRVRLDSHEETADTPLLLTVEEAARRLRIGRTRMYDLVRSGAVRAVYVGRLRRVPTECLQEYVTRLITEGEG
ncbi:helix-turn-helix domain-containing protein [Microbispora amethystogenes]|uniref:helix-turn-helix domain-containing protein n=1 Tax=Microbispora amethystogenes TaxID=1427754 RepID=UPI0033EEDDBE